MTAIVWDQVGQHGFEFGVDKGVLYLSDGSGVPWSGLTSVEDKSSSGGTTPLYFEGVKYNDVVTVNDFVASVKAFTYPEEFLQFEGVISVEPGFYVTGQVPGLFGLSYRSKIGNDTNQNAGYKLHILSNLTAIPSNKAYQTQAGDTKPIEFEWTVTAIPTRIAGFRPTSHLIIDSTKFDAEVLQTIEDILYGTDSTEAHLPNFNDFVDLVTVA